MKEEALSVLTFICVCLAMELGIVRGSVHARCWITNKLVNSIVIFSISLIFLEPRDSVLLLYWVNILLLYQQ